MSNDQEAPEPGLIEATIRHLLALIRERGDAAQYEALLRARAYPAGRQPQDFHPEDGRHRRADQYARTLNWLLEQSDGTAVSAWTVEAPSESR
jgi:hypothetical protein